MAGIQELLERLWQDYQALNPDAKAIHALLEGKGESIVNDHIAFRTYDRPKIGLEKLAAPFLERGYRLGDRYEFPEKKLLARHYEPDDPSLPKLFISELRTEEFSKRLQETVAALVAQVPDDLPARWDFPVSGRPWEVSYATYEALAEESEYAAWVAAFGFRANHFTISVNALKEFSDLAALNTFLKSHGFVLNDSGGEIKGAPEVFLEQSSTRARPVPVWFQDGEHEIPGCYYEFAKRYPMPDGRLFEGFVAKSADRIFESTNRR